MTSINTAPPQADHETLLTAEEVSTMLRMSIDSVYLYGRTGRLAAIRFDRAVRFRRSEVLLHRSLGVEAGDAGREGAMAVERRENGIFIRYKDVDGGWRYRRTPASLAASSKRERGTREHTNASPRPPQAVTKTVGCTAPV